MFLKITHPGSDLLVPAINAGPILAALEHAFSVRSEGWGKDQKWVKAEGDIACSFVSETLLNEAPEPLKKALADYETAQQNWLAEYNRRAAAEKTVKELEEKLKKLQDAVTA